MEPKKPAESAKNIYQRLHAAMLAVSYVQKEDKKVNNQYTFVSHDAVTAAVRGPLMEQGVIYFPQNLQYTQDGNRTEVTLEIHFVNIEAPDDRIIVPSFGFGIDQGDKGPGKAVSYAVKYALLKALGLETGDDPEQNASATHTPGKPKEKASDNPLRDRADEINKALKAADSVAKIDQIWNLQTADLEKIKAASAKAYAALDKTYLTCRDYLLKQEDDIPDFQHSLMAG